MTFSSLLKAPHVGVRALKSHLSKNLKGRKPIVVTDRGEPKKVIIDYDDMLELVELVEDMRDKEMSALIRDGREAVGRGAAGLPVGRSFAKIRAARKR